ncbi:unnamed protein product [Somion occarium]|uniref:Methyltransferase domain-containing protein n=1 Tax=Somion occarium TaxID=3059160 RepID=A0ABP1CPA9_9APHY
MALMFQRNPRYVLLVVVICAITFLLFTHSNFGLAELPVDVSGLPNDPSLPARIARSERMYQKTLEKRQELIKKHGPTPERVVMFPPDKDPWPAYTAWDFFPPTFDCPHDLERIGSAGDGGKWICGLSRLEDKPNCVIYTFGVDWDSSFEGEVLSRTRHCEIWGHDALHTGFGHQIPKDLKHRTHFAQLQLGPKDSHGPDDTPKIWTLQSLMRQNGHKHIDILKIDIEGWEFDTLRSIVQTFLDWETPLPFGQLQMEIHAWNKKFPDFLNWFEFLESAGLRPFMSAPNLVYVNYNRQSGAELVDYSFLNIKGQNVFVSQPSLEDHTRDGVHTQIPDV